MSAAPRPPYLAPDWTPDQVGGVSVPPAADEIAELRRTVGELGRAVAELLVEVAALKAAKADLQARLASAAERIFQQGELLARHAAKSVPTSEIQSPPA